MRHKPLDPQAGFLSLSTLCVALLGIAWTGCITQPTDPGQASDSDPSTVDTVMVAPSDVELYPGDIVQFAAVAMLESGEQASVEFDWEATGGTVDESGKYTAGSETGEFHVEAKEPGDGKGNAWGAGGRARVQVKKRSSDEDPPESPNQVPTAAFTSSCDELACFFDASGSSDADGAITGHAWTLGDESSGSGETVAHDYGDGGTYDVRLTVTDDAGAASSVTHSLEVAQAPANQAPTAAFEHTCQGTTCSFDASASTDPDGSLASWTWELGDGTTAEGQQVEHTYGTAGTYEVRLTVMDDDGASNSQTNSVAVEDSESEDPPGDPLDTTIYPGEDIQAAVDANPGGTSFLIKAGVHRLQSVRPKTGNEFVGEPGAIISGAKLLTEFERDGGLWVATGQTQENPSRPGVCRDGSGNEGARYAAAPRCNYPEDLFIDDTPLFHVDSRGDVGPGSWFFDYVNDRIYFYDDPTGRIVETSVTTRAFNGENGVGSVTISGLIVEKYANPAQTGAIAFPNGSDWLVADNEVRYNHGVGIGLATNSGAQILRNYIHHNGQLGLGAFKPVNLLVEDNEFAYNGRAGYRDAWEAGGNKIVASRGTVLRGNHSHHNYGKGIWLDYDNSDFVIEANTAEYNDAHGVFLEANCRGMISGNTLRYNGTYGVIVDTSHDVDVFANAMVGNGDFWPDGHSWRHPYQAGARTSPHAGKVESNCGTLELTDVRFYDNQIATGNGLGASEMAAPDGALFDENDYDLAGSLASPFLYRGSTKTVEEWQGLGYDENSSF